jgi:hypothetical protein
MSEYLGYMYLHTLFFFNCHLVELVLDTCALRLRTRSINIERGGRDVNRVHIHSFISIQPLGR